MIMTPGEDGCPGEDRCRSSVRSIDMLLAFACVRAFQFYIRRGEALATYVLVVVCSLELLYFYDSDHIILVPFYCIYNYHSHLLIFY